MEPPPEPCVALPEAGAGVLGAVVPEAGPPADGVVVSDVLDGDGVVSEDAAGEGVVPDAVAGPPPPEQPASVRARVRAAVVAGRAWRAERREGGEGVKADLRRSGEPVLPDAGPTGRRAVREGRLCIAWVPV
ncbi:hypothetical protein GCM10022203_14050 [Micrococcus yunnanensis]|nr:hypothetical protein GCM10007073_20480 [Micrococcus flavus]